MLQCDLGLAHATIADQGEERWAGVNLIEGFMKDIKKFIATSKTWIAVIWDSKKCSRYF